MKRIHVLISMIMLILSVAYHAVVEWFAGPVKRAFAPPIVQRAIGHVSKGFVPRPWSYARTSC